MQNRGLEAASLIYIYCLRKSEGAQALVDSIRTLGERAEYGGKPMGAEFVVNWGSKAPRRYRPLNMNVIGNKLQELSLLNKTCPSPLCSTTPEAGFLLRSVHHTGARDLIRPRQIQGARYYVEFVPTDREFRLHVFQGRVIRAALKVSDSPEPHPWIRSHRTGWTFDYGRKCQAVLTNRVRKAARQAVTALNYDFGAVDIGVKEDGSPIVFEVNSAPGFFHSTTSLQYARSIIRWTKGQQRDRGRD